MRLLILLPILTSVCEILTGEVNGLNRRVSILIQSPVTFLQIPHDHWYQPDWIDEARATDGRNKMVMKNIIYGGSVSYRNMCRFNSGVRLLLLSSPLPFPSLLFLPFECDAYVLTGYCIHQ